MVIFKKICIAIMLYCCWPLSGFAQSDNTSIMIINIKRDTTYLYAESTMKDKDLAFRSAHTLLEMKVKDRLGTLCESDSVARYVARAEENCKELVARRGDYWRAFVYIKKSDILPVDSSHLVTQNQIIQLTADEKKMTSISRFSDIEPYIKSLKAESRVKAYGKYATMPKDELCHVFIYNHQGDIKAVLRVLPDSQLNLQTLQQDNIKNYKNHGAFWLQLKNK